MRTSVQISTQSAGVASGLLNMFFASVTNPGCHTERGAFPDMIHL
jgi:hypothetical protein